jgi:ubiquinone/menaquinone biosynthesis C-methylase UbiE
MAIQLAKSRRTVRVTGIDISAAFVARANQNSHTAGVADRATFALGDASDMSGFADASFDAIMSNQSLHYWHPPECVFDQIARVLKPRGIFCIADDRRDLNWQGTLEVLVGRFIHSRRIGSSWARSLLGCFTPSEVTDALERSALRDRWQMTVRPRSMLITSKPA